MKIFLRHLPFALILLPAPALADIQNLDALERRLVIALGADIGQPGGPTTALDRRLKLAACPADVSIEPAVMGAAVLRCAEIGWRIRVPLVRGGKTLPAGGNALPANAPANTPTYVQQRRAAPVIRRGDPVDLVAGDAGFNVSSQVIAEQDGAPGDRIRVRGDRAKPPIMAEVVDAATVRLPAFK